MTFIGVDPGKKGSLALLENGAVSIFPFDEDTYIEMLGKVAPHASICCLEHVGSMPGQGVTSMFHFGENFGFIQGVLRAYKIPFELVRPQKWKKEFSITGDKNSSIQVCKRLFPDVRLFRTARCTKEDDNMAEAVLLSEYARRKLGVAQCENAS
ncbi:hypothetical protein PND83_02400 [Flavonifractor plautii]|jgi:crossover junction endodeoxyribonuclease RuvC|uniref:Uncharacterized protein n=2 Tax=Flavonifractor plautii TaxID=292800 RepID=A0AAW6C1I7_FLAPL|nr:hypothetical protein [Flavonifractor plautii]MDB7887187.1 hypothetical protein [Flavonifractor plautii]MDB7904821.1 hypothetical protein [Flavonifractor plautii]DAI07809.1 MAG TPA: HOLLIDAY JUNCTION RESOLVASE [Bacteriophage sp.]